MTARTAIIADWMVPVDESMSTLRNAGVVVEDNVIVQAGRVADLDLRDADVTEFPHHVLLPGLVNAHTHVTGAIFRGLLEDRPNHFYGFALPMERHLTGDIVHRIGRLGIAELLLHGCTCMNDMFHYSADTAKAAAELRIRAQIAHKVYDADLPRIGEGIREYDFDSGLARLTHNIDLHDSWHDRADGRIQIRFGAHAADTCSPELQREIRDAATSRGAGIHTHAAQSKGEVEFIAARYGCTSLQLLHRQGLLAPSTITAHVLFAPTTDVALLAETNTAVAHCPSCVAKVAAAIGPFRQIYNAGVNVGWGTDWVSMDPWDCMRMGIVCLRLAEGDELLLSARDALWRFTMGAATILGLEHSIGSLQVGKRADLILADTDQPHLAPMYDPISTLVYNASGRDVTHTMVDGAFVVDDRRLVTVDLEDVLAQAQEAANEFWAAAGSADCSLPPFRPPNRNPKWHAS